MLTNHASKSFRGEMLDHKKFPANPKINIIIENFIDELCMMIAQKNWPFSIKPQNKVI
jgi:hypothetical protein